MPTPADEHGHDVRRGITSGVSAYVLWGFLTVYWKELEHFAAFDLIGWRIVAAAITVAVLLARPWRPGTSRWGHLRPILRDRGLALRVVGASVLLTVNWTSYVWAVVHGHVIETALGYFIAPLGTILIGVVVFGEHLRRAQQVAVVLALGAIAILTVSYGRVPVLALALALSWSGYGWLKKQIPLTPLESMSAESFTLAVPALVLVAVMSTRHTSVWQSADAWHIALVALSGVATVVPLMMFAYAAPRVPLTVLGPMQYAVPTINFLLGWIVYDEAMPAARLAGFALVWVGLVLVTVDTVHRTRRSGRSVPTASPSSTVEPAGA